MCILLRNCADSYESRLFPCRICTNTKISNWPIYLFLRKVKVNATLVATHKEQNCGSSSHDRSGIGQLETGGRGRVRTAENMYLCMINMKDFSDRSERFHHKPYVFIIFDFFCPYHMSVHVGVPFGFEQIIF